MHILETERLSLRTVTADDAPFIFELINEPAWKENIRDSNIHTLDETIAYIERVFTGSYDKHGFGLYLVELKETGEPVGICGLVKRDSLEDVDIGFAFLTRTHGRGYATESAGAMLNHAKTVMGIPRIVAITSQTNHASAHVLEKIGLKFLGNIKLPEYEHEERFFSTI